MHWARGSGGPRPQSGYAVRLRLFEDSVMAEYTVQPVVTSLQEANSEDKVGETCGGLRTSHLSHLISGGLPSPLSTHSPAHTVDRTGTCTPPQRTPGDKPPFPGLFPESSWPQPVKEQVPPVAPCACWGHPLLPHHPHGSSAQPGLTLGNLCSLLVPLPRAASDVPLVLLAGWLLES